MKIDSGDVKGFVLGVMASITAVILWDYYKKKKHRLDYAEENIIKEMQSAIEGLKKHINDKV